MVVNIDSTWAECAAKMVLRIRIVVGWVCLSEGIQKFLFPDALGVGRFVKIGIPWPHVMAPFCRGCRDCLWLSAVDRSCYAAGDGTASH
jgi:uncharacterized membrane protein YphA (DoxX/SURF4 family)